MNRWYFDLSEESRLHLEKLYKSKNVSEPSIWKDSEGKSNESWKKELEQCSDLDLATSTLHLLTFFFCHTCPLQFIFCISYSVFGILYCVFLILHFRISSGYFFASLDFSLRGQRNSKFVVLHILQFLLHCTLHIACFYWMMLHCILWQEALAVLVQ